MGYRSTVRMSTTEEGYEFLNEAATKRALESGVVYPLFSLLSTKDFNYDFVSAEGGSVVFGFDEVKWYESYGDVQAFEKGLCDLDEAGYPWMFLRLGEDFEDFELRYGNGAYDADIPHLYAESSYGWY